MIDSMHKPRLLIVFPYEWLAYYPTLAYLQDALENDFEIHTFAPSPSYFQQVATKRKNVHFVRVPIKLKGAVARLDSLLQLLGIPLQFSGYLSALALYLAARPYKASLGLGVDFEGFSIVQRLCRHAFFLSVDIIENSIFRSWTNQGRIEAVLIPTEERFQHVFAGLDVPRIFLANAPVYRPVSIKPSARNGLIYCGSALPNWGIFAYLDFLIAYPEHCLTVKGSIPADVEQRILSDYSVLLDNRQLVVNKEYLEFNEIGEFLQRFRIGFCLYSLESFPQHMLFNQMYGSYGKLFSYYAAGVPVVASDLPGMRSVTEFGTGVIVKDSSPGSLASAIAQIEANYETYAANCLRAAEYFSVDRPLEHVRLSMLQKVCNDPD